MLSSSGEKAAQPDRWQLDNTVSKFCGQKRCRNSHHSYPIRADALVQSVIECNQDRYVYQV